MIDEPWHLSVHISVEGGGHPSHGQSSHSVALSGVKSTLPSESVTVGSEWDGQKSL